MLVRPFNEAQANEFSAFRGDVRVDNGTDMAKPGSVVFLDQETGRTLFKGALLDLPCIVEHHEHDTSYSIVKQRDVSQIVVLQESLDKPHKFRDRAHNSGITPPTQGIRKKLYEPNQQALKSPTQHPGLSEMETVLLCMRDGVNLHEFELVQELVEVEVQDTPAPQATLLAPTSDEEKSEQEEEEQHPTPFVPEAVVSRVSETITPAVDVKKEIAELDKKIAAQKNRILANRLKKQRMGMLPLLPLPHQ